MIGFAREYDGSVRLYPFAAPLPRVNRFRQKSYDKKGTLFTSRCPFTPTRPWRVR